jgi:hypothetical protein
MRIAGICLLNTFLKNLENFGMKKLFKEWHSGRLKHKKIFSDYDERVDGDENEDWNRYILINEIDIIQFDGLEDLGIKSKDWHLVDNILYLKKTSMLKIKDVFEVRFEKFNMEKFKWFCVLKNN